MEQNQTAELLEKLATKLGTTSEYLWSVLIHQAPISATITLVQIALILFAGRLLWKLHKKFDKDKLYEEYEFATGCVMICSGVCWLILMIMALFAIEDVISGYFNPEYWALNKIFNSLKQ